MLIIFSLINSNSCKKKLTSILNLSLKEMHAINHMILANTAR